MKNLLRFTKQEMIKMTSINDMRKKALEREREIRSIQKIIDNGGYCCLCGYYDDPRILEEHHISGRKHSDITITVCPNCHKILSLGQRSWPKEWLKYDNNNIIKTALELRGFSDIDKLRSQRLRELSDIFLRGEMA